MRDQVLHFTNQGVLDIYNLILMGASTKKGDPEKIGKYGSGWKYAIACFLRNNIEIDIRQGNHRVKITTRPIKMQDKIFDMVVVDGIDTNYTTELGEDWELWMALREVYCNVLDEHGGCMNLNDKRCSPLPQSTAAEMTQVFIPVTPKIEAIYKDWTMYFAFDREKDIVMKDHGVTVYKKRGINSVIYRKGIMVGTSNKKGCYDYDFHDIPINEIRQMRCFSDVEDRLRMFMQYNINCDVLTTILQSDSTWEKESKFYSWQSLGTETKKVWKDVIGKKAVVPLEYADKLLTAKTKEKQEKLQEDGEDETILLMPACMAQLISTEIPDTLVLGYGKGTALVYQVEPTPEQDKIIDQAMNNLIQLFGDGTPEVQIEIVQFENSYSESSTHGEVISIAQRLVTDVPTVEFIIFKEVILRKTNAKSGTMDAQNHILRMLYDLMVQQNKAVCLTKQNTSLVSLPSS